MVVRDVGQVLSLALETSFGGKCCRFSSQLVLPSSAAATPKIEVLVIVSLFAAGAQI